jgi:pSer/pThr/pTyr-binding forkhead associated (FHA) protein
VFKDYIAQSFDMAMEIIDLKSKTKRFIPIKKAGQDVNMQVVVAIQELPNGDLITLQKNGALRLWGAFRIHVNGDNFFVCVNTTGFF